MSEAFIIIYALGFVFFAICTWIDNASTYHVFGPPSGLITGLLWPFIVAAFVIYLIVAKLSRSTPTSKDADQ